MSKNPPTKASDPCARKLCGRRGVITTSDGQRYCKQHADHLPAYLRRSPRKSKGK